MGTRLSLMLVGINSYFNENMKKQKKRARNSQIKYVAKFV